MSELVVDVVNEAGTTRLAHSLAAALAVRPDSSVIALCGPLGAGKTRFVRALAATLGVNPDEVASPTFVLLHEYAGKRPIYHCDAYRLRSARELWELGIEEMFSAEAITLIEWADHVADALPADYLEVRIEVTGDTSRRIRLRAIGADYEAVVDLLRRASQ